MIKLPIPQTGPTKELTDIYTSLHLLNGSTRTLPTTGQLIPGEFYEAFPFTGFVDASGSVVTKGVVNYTTSGSSGFLWASSAGISETLPDEPDIQMLGFIIEQNKVFLNISGIVPNA